MTIMLRKMPVEATRMNWSLTVPVQILALLVLFFSGCSESGNAYRESSDGSGVILYVSKDIALVKIMGRVQLVKARYIGKPTWGWSTGDSIEETLVENIEQIYFDEESGSVILKEKLHPGIPTKFYAYHHDEIYKFKSSEELAERFPKLSLDFNSFFLRPDEFFEKYKPQ